MKRAAFVGTVAQERSSNELAADADAMHAAAEGCESFRETVPNVGAVDPKAVLNL